MQQLNRQNAPRAMKIRTNKILETSWQQLPNQRLSNPARPTVLSHTCRQKFSLSARDDSRGRTSVLISEFLGGGGEEYFVCKFKLVCNLYLVLKR